MNKNSKLLVFGNAMMLTWCHYNNMIKFHIDIFCVIYHFWNEVTNHVDSQDEAIASANDKLLSVRPYWTNFCEILVKIKNII